MREVSSPGSLLRRPLLPDSTLGIFILSLLLRLLLVAYGSVLANSFPDFPQYTDIDYFVYSDAAHLVAKGGSPYDRSTYRYPPLMAYINIPNIWNDCFGKLVFCIIDAALVICFDHFYDTIHGPIIERGSSSSALYAKYDQNQRRLVQLLWCFNPFAINICSRGSSDSIINISIVLLIIELSKASKLSRDPLTRSDSNWHYILAGGILGWSIYWRLYPIIYALPSCIQIIRDAMCFRRPNSYPFKESATLLTYFMISLVIILGLLVGLSYAVCGQEYLDESIFYHFHRKDHRHNFAPHFYGIYLSSSSYLPSSDASNYAIASPSQANSLIKLFLLSLIEYAPSLSQFLTLISITIPLAREKISLSQCILLQTLSFVSYNKVITAQYFMWFLSLLPLAYIELCSPLTGAAPQPSSMRCVGLAASAWLASLVIWLGLAYLLEFKGLDTFMAIWIVSLLFHMAGVYLIYSLLCFFIEMNDQQLKKKS